MNRTFFIALIFMALGALAFACGELQPSEEEAATKDETSGDSAKDEVYLRLNFDPITADVDKILIWMVMGEREHKLETIDVEADDIDRDDPEILLPVKDFDELMEDDGELCLVISAWSEFSGESENSAKECIDLETRPES